MSPLNDTLGLSTRNPGKIATSLSAGLPSRRISDHLEKPRACNRTDQFVKRFFPFFPGDRYGVPGTSPHRVSGRTHVVEEVIPCHFEGDEGISSPKPYFTNWSKSVG